MTARQASREASDDGPLTGIVAAMEEEVAGLRARIARAQSVTLSGDRVTLGWLGGAYIAILFGLLAFQSFQLLQEAERNRRYWHQDDSTPWERDPTIWRR